MDLHRGGSLRRAALYEVKEEAGVLKDCVVAADGKVRARDGLETGQERGADCLEKG